MNGAYFDPDTGEDYEPPEEYGLIQTAKWLGVAPWELAAQPVVWQQWAGAIAEAEAHAKEVRERQAGAQQKS